MSVKSDGILAFVITQEVLKGKGAGEGFRRFQLGQDGSQLKAIKAHDLVAVSPFEGAANKTAVLVIKKGEETIYPVPYVLWRKVRGKGTLLPDMNLEEAKQVTSREEQVARPIGDNLYGSWQTTTPNQQDALTRLRGVPAYKAHIGARVEPYGVYWLQLLLVRPDGILFVENLPELGKKVANKIIPKVKEDVEADLVYPAIRGKDIRRWIAKPRIYTLIVQDPHTRKGYPIERMKVEWPNTFSYLHKFEKRLRERAAFKKYYKPTDPFYSQFNISTETFAPYRVTWKRMADDLVAAVLSTWETPIGKRQPIGTDTTSFIAVDNADEAHYLCALLNSAPVRSYIQSFSSAGRGFGSSSIIKQLSLPIFAANDSTHRRLSDLSQVAHDIAFSDSADLSETENSIDKQAATLWGIPVGQLEAMQTSLAKGIGRIEADLDSHPADLD